MNEARLQLVSVPRGAKVAPVERTPLEPGEVLPLGPKGRSLGSDAELRIEGVDGLAKVHAVLKPEDGGWRLFHYGTAFRTWVNGVPKLDVKLQHLDVLEIPKGPVFRFLDGPDAEAELPELEAQVRENPDALESLLVYGDALSDAGDGFGSYLLREGQGATDETERAKWLGPLARPFHEGRVQLRWKHGLIREAVFRELQPFGVDSLERLRDLFALRSAMGLQQLEVDCGGYEANAEAAVELLAAVAPKGLRRVSLGECFAGEPWPELHHGRWQQKLSRAIEGCVLEPIRFFRRAELEGLDGKRRPCERQEYFSASDEARRGALGTVAGMYRLELEASRWRLTAIGSYPARVNHREVKNLTLRDGDFLDLGPRHRFNFRLVR